MRCAPPRASVALALLASRFRRGPWGGLLLARWAAAARLLVPVVYWHFLWGPQLACTSPWRWCLSSARGRAGAWWRTWGGSSSAAASPCGDLASSQPSATTAEASWHRRARRHRQHARAILAVERARRTLAAHHGGGVCESLGSDGSTSSNFGMPNGRGPGFTNWDCHICGKPDNAGWRTRCRSCEAYPKPGARRPKGGGKGDGWKGSSTGKNNNDNSYSTEHSLGTVSAVYGGSGKGKGGKGDRPLGSFAQRQIQQQQRSLRAQAAVRTNEKELQDARRRNEILAEQNRKLQREVEDAKQRRPTCEEEDEEMEGPEDWSEADRRARMEKIRASLPHLEDQYGVESELHKDAQDELEHHGRALRESKPFKTHRTILERKVERLQRQQSRDRERLTELNEAADEIRLKITTTAAAMADREKELEAAESELKELILRSMGEDSSGGAQPPAPDPSQGWDAVVQAVSTLASKPGVPEHVAGQLEGLFGQIRTMVAALQTHATAMGATGTPAAGGTSGNAGAAETEQITHPPQRPDSAAAELRQQQTQAWRQRRSTAAINHIICQHRAAQAAAEVEACKTATTAAAPAAPSNSSSSTSKGGGRDRSRSNNSRRGGRNHNGNASSESGATDQRGGSITMGGITGATPPEPEAAATTVAAAAPAATGVAAAAIAAPVALARETPAAPADGLAGVQLDDGGAETDITGLASDASETEGERMEVDSIVSQIPAEQRASVRALIELRRVRRTRRLQRHKKPADGEVAPSRDPKRR